MRLLRHVSSPSKKYMGYLPDNEGSEQGALLVVASDKDRGGQVEGQWPGGSQARDVLGEEGLKGQCHENCFQTETVGW